MQIKMTLLAGDKQNLRQLRLSPIPGRNDKKTSSTPYYFQSSLYKIFQMCMQINIKRTSKEALEPELRVMLERGALLYLHGGRGGGRMYRNHAEDIRTCVKILSVSLIAQQKGDASKTCPQS